MPDQLVTEDEYPCGYGFATFRSHALDSSLTNCWACNEPRPKLDPISGRYGCFYCAPVKVPRK
jgi:hypothetical protein